MPPDIEKWSIVFRFSTISLNRPFKVIFTELTSTKGVCAPMKVCTVGENVVTTEAHAVFLFEITTRHGALVTKFPTF